MKMENMPEPKNSLSFELTIRFAKRIFLVILLLAITRAPAQNPEKKAIDSLLSVLKSTKDEILRVNILNDIAYEFKRSDPDTAIYFANEAQVIAIRLNYKIGIATAFINISSALITLGDYEVAFKKNNEALTICDQLPASEKTAEGQNVLKQKSRAYNNLGIICQLKGDYPESLKNYLLALKIRERIHDEPGIAMVYNNLGNINHLQSNFPEAMKNYFIALKIRLKLGDKKGAVDSYNNIGSVYAEQSNYTEALKNYNASLRIAKETGNKPGMAFSFNNIGNIFWYQGNYPEALKNYFIALKIFEETGDKKNISNSYNNIGIIYQEQGNYPEALKNYLSSMKIRDELGDKQGICECYNNIGIIMEEQGNYPEALKNHYASLSIEKEIGDQQGIANSYSNIGNIYFKQKNYSQALKMHFASLKIAEETGDKQILATSYINIGNIYTKQKKFTEASRYLNTGLLFAKEIGSLAHLNQCFERLAALDSAQGNYKESLEHYKMYIQTRDSLFSQENTRKLVQSKMQYEFDKKFLADSLANEEAKIKRELVYTETLHKKEKERNTFLISGLAILLIAAALWNRLQYIRKSRTILQKEKDRSENLLLNILPMDVADELKIKGRYNAKSYSMVSVLFTDFKDFTRVSEMVSAENMVNELDVCFSSFDAIIQKHRVEKIKTIGDAYMCASGLPAVTETHAFDLVSAAIEIRDFMLNRKKEKEARGEIPFEIRIGIHTGPIVAGIVGTKKFAYDIWGDSVNIAARMESSGEAGKINISETTYEMVKDKFNCVYRGKVAAKNKGAIDMYFVASPV
jgi:adenylate cyclase